MLDDQVKVFGNMFNQNGHYVPGSLANVDWGLQSKRYTVPEDPMGRLCGHDFANITKRMHVKCGKRVARIFNDGADAEHAKVLGVAIGTAVWPESSSDMGNGQRKLPDDRKRLLINWASADAERDDFQLGIVSDESLAGRMEKGPQYAPIGFAFASLIINDVLCAVSHDLFGMLLPPQAVMSKAQITSGVRDLMKRNYVGFAAPDEGLCIAKYYDRGMWDGMTDGDQEKSQKNRVLNPSVMACADVVMYAVAYGRTVTDAFCVGLVSAETYFETRKRWWREHWQQVPALMEHVWGRTVTQSAESESDNDGSQDAGAADAEQDGGGADAGSDGEEGMQDTPIRNKGKGAAQETRRGQQHADGGSSSRGGRGGQAVTGGLSQGETSGPKRRREASPDDSPQR
jgi:hypothetical protein